MSELRPIRELADQVRGVTYAKDEASTSASPGKVAVLRAGNIQESELSLSDLVYVPQARVSEDQMIRKHDVLIATSSGSLDVVGKAAQALLDLGMAFGAFCKVLRPKPGINPRYFAHYFRTHQYRHVISRLAAGANINNLRNEHLDELLVPIPGDAEQRRIADILDKADSIRRKRKQAIAVTEDLLRAIFLDMFGDPATNPRGWPVKPLAIFGELDRGRSRHRPRNEPSLLGGKHPLIQTGEVANCDGVISSYEQTYSDLGLAQSKMWPAGTLCITIAANIAKTGVLAFDACFPDSVVGFTPGGDATTEYVQYWLGFLQPVLERQAPQSAQKNINLEILRTLGVPAPDVGLQRRFSTVVARIRRSRGNLRQALDGSEKLFQGLVAGAFAGSLELAC